MAVFRRRYVKPQSIATARCKWDRLTFEPASQTFQDFLEQYQKLAREAHGEDAPKFIQSSFYAKMPPHLKRVLNQARLENETYDEMVAHLEREMELNGLANPETSSITGINNIELQQTEHQPERKKGTCDYCGNQGHFKHQCRKLKNDQRNNTRQGPRRAISTCETCGKRGHEAKECFSGANWANRPSWWRAPQATGNTNYQPATFPNNQPILQPQQPQPPPAIKPPQVGFQVESTQTEISHAYLEENTTFPGQFPKN